MRVLGVDYGERRIGLALSDPTGVLASPWKTLANVADVRSAARQIVSEAERLRNDDTGLDVIVVGLPRRLSGAPNALTLRVQRLVALIAAEIDMRIVLQDERLTSREADELLARRERDWRRRKKQLDAFAAALILQDYLDGSARSAHTIDTDRK